MLMFFVAATPGFAGDHAKWGVKQGAKLCVHLHFQHCTFVTLRVRAGKHYRKCDCMFHQRGGL